MHSYTRGRYPSPTKKTITSQYSSLVTNIVILLLPNQISAMIIVVPLRNLSSQGTYSSYYGCYGQIQWSQPFLTRRGPTAWLLTRWPFGLENIVDVFLQIPQSGGLQSVKVNLYLVGGAVLEGGLLHLNDLHHFTQPLGWQLVDVETQLPLFVVCHGVCIFLVAAGETAEWPLLHR